MLARELSNEGYMAQFYDKEVISGAVKLALNASLADWAVYVKQNFRSNYHNVRSCSMMARELGGVLDPQGRVYDVQGLRVIDASILPTQVSAHIMTVIYRVATKLGADILVDYSTSMTKITKESKLMVQKPGLK